VNLKNLIWGLSRNEFSKYFKNKLRKMDNELIKLLREFPDEPWDWGKFGLSMNSNITFDIILREEWVW